MPTAVKTYAGEQSLGHKDVEPPYDFHEGDVVVYHPVGGSQVTTVGLVRDVLQEPDIVGEGRAVTVKATEEDPRFIIENLHTRKETPYRRSSILRLASEKDIQDLKSKGISVPDEADDYLQLQRDEEMHASSRS